MDLIEDYQGAAVLGSHPMASRMRRDLRVGHDDTLEVRTGLARAVAETRIEGDTRACGSCGPLVLEMLGGRDDGDLIHGAVGQQFGGDPQAERRLACTRGRDRQEVSW